MFHIIKDDATDEYRLALCLWQPNCILHWYFIYIFLVFMVFYISVNTKLHSSAENNDNNKCVATIG